MNERVLVGMASIPERLASLEQAISSLAPQADRIVVSLNEYERPPAFLSRFRNVEVLLPGTKNGGDAEKFAAVDDWDGFVATVDDDVLYPENYIAELLAGIDRHGRTTAVGFHGGKTFGWNGAPMAATHKQIRCLDSLARDDTDVNVLGTGAMGWHAAQVPIWRSVFRHANMADVHMACHARSVGISMAALEHRGGWLRDIGPEAGRKIYQSNKQRDGSSCDTNAQRRGELRRFDWLAPVSRPHVRVSVATCGRPEKLLELLQDLDRESKWVDLEVGIYQDPDGSNYTAARDFCLERGWVWQRFHHRLARRNHWVLVNQQFADAKESDAGWFVFMPDDVRLVRHALPKAIDLWQRLSDPSTLTLWRLLSLEGLTNWTGKRSVRHSDATEVFHVDGLYLCRRDTLEYLRFRCTNPGPRSSSGVGRQISLALDRAGKRMYRVDESLVTCNDDGISIMNPAERLRHPAVAL